MVSYPFTVVIRPSKTVTIAEFTSPELPIPEARLFVIPVPADEASLVILLPENIESILLIVSVFHEEVKVLKSSPANFSISDTKLERLSPSTAFFVEDTMEETVVESVVS